MANHVNRPSLGRPTNAFHRIHIICGLTCVILITLALLPSPAAGETTTIIFSKDLSFLECVGFVIDSPGTLHIFDLEPWQEVSAHSDRGAKVFHFQADEYGHLEAYVPVGGIKIGLWRNSIEDPRGGPECQTARSILGL